MRPIGDETGENGQPRFPAGFDFRAGRINIGTKEL
jgi:hypothetical protein